MKIKMIVAADTALALTVSAPRRTRFKHVGGKWKALQRKRALEYKRNKTKILQKARQYRKKNAAKLKQRAAFLERQPKRAIKTIMSGNTR